MAGGLARRNERHPGVPHGRSRWFDPGAGWPGRYRGPVAMDIHRYHPDVIPLDRMDFARRRSDMENRTANERPAPCLSVHPAWNADHSTVGVHSSMKDTLCASLTWSRRWEVRR